VVKINIKKMSENKKRVRLDENNKLVVEDNNAVTTIEGTTSKISGVYEISADDVANLLVLINNNTALKPITEYSILERRYAPHTQILTCDEALDKALSIVSEEYNELEKECKEWKDRYMTMKGNFDNLLEKVKKHNKNRLFNKIKID
jgi:molecular chaperone GrpE (heat shock protein)